VTGPVAIIIGPPGAGKSTVGALLAAKLGVPFTDADSVIAETAGKPVSDIFVQDGEAAFRVLERATAAQLIGGQPGVLALGGGAVLDPATQKLLDGQRVIYLETGFRTVVHRSGMGGPHPPIPGNPRGRLKQMLDERHPVYAGLAWRTVATDDRDPEDLAGSLAAELAAQP
jgi:shikimate kinase